MKIMNSSVVTYVEVDYYEFEKFVIEYYGFENREWSFVADQECGNDCNIAFTVNGKVDEYDEDELEKFKANPEQIGYFANALLNDFARKGLIEKGQYLINVCW